MNHPLLTRKMDLDEKMLRRSRGGLRTVSVAASLTREITGVF